MSRRPFLVPRRLAVLALAAVLVAASGLLAHAPAPAEAATADSPTRFEFERLNRTFRMEDSEMDPVEQGPITIHLAVPASALILKSHSLVLEPLGDGSHRAEVGIDFLGSGDLVADFVAPAGATSRLEDRVVAPRQTIALAGRVSFARVPGGWDVTAHELPPKVTVAIQSQVANGLISLCEQMALLLVMVWLNAGLLTAKPREA